MIDDALTTQFPTADADLIVRQAASAAQQASGSLRSASQTQLDTALRAMARMLRRAKSSLMEANAQDVESARSGGMSEALIDRLRLGEERLEAMADQLFILADAPADPLRREIRSLPGELILEEWRRPVGTIGANFEARPNVVVDIASQFVKSRNAGVLRTGSAALQSAISLVDAVVAPALQEAELDPSVIQVLRAPGHQLANALVRQPTLLPLVILRGSGSSTRSLALEAAHHGVRTLAHADGGGVLYIDGSADLRRAAELVEGSLDRLGVCNRLNLLLIQDTIWSEALTDILPVLERLGIEASLPPHAHALGLEWALEDGREATVTISKAAGASDAARIANDETSGLAAGIVAEDPDAVAHFLEHYSGTGAFHNATTRLLDGFKLFAVPETGINLDNVPGPRGPVTFHDLHVRQLVVRPSTTV